MEYPKRDYSDARRQYAYWLRQHGYNFREIGERLGVSSAQANSMVRGYENDPAVWKEHWKE